jgi:uncharacterized membrane protein
MESLLYSISGLPVHPLVVHFAVVVLPVSALALIAIIYTPKIKSKYSFITTAGIILGSAAVLIAKQSGEALAEQIGNPATHSNYGSLLTAGAFILMLLTILWYRSSKGRRSRVVTPLSHATAIAAIIVLLLTFLTGHSGAQAVWEGKLASATSTQAKASPTPKATAATKAKGTYTSADLAKHASVKSCWSAINGSVYDLTRWVAKHPGGRSVIIAICGRDGSASFSGQHGGAAKPASFLAKYKIGKFA